MKLYLDTASVKEILEASVLGILDGVTTNPSLVAKEGTNVTEALQESRERATPSYYAQAMATHRDRPWAFLGPFTFRLPSAQSRLFEITYFFFWGRSEYA